MTRIESRNSQTRENETREETEYVFEEPNATYIPPAVEERFRQQGLSLGWLRILLNGQDDYQEVGKKQQQGWEFITPEEVPEMGATSVLFLIIANREHLKDVLHRFRSSPKQLEGEI